MGTNEQIARLILQQTWEEREMLADELNVDAQKIGQWAKSMEAPEPAAQDDDGWIEWAGGRRCPVAPDALVTVRLRSGTILDRYRRADFYRWFHYSGSADDIIAYKVIKP